MSHAAAPPNTMLTRGIGLLRKMVGGSSATALSAAASAQSETANGHGPGGH